jgi:hypothetical protein
MEPQWEGKANTLSALDGAFSRIGLNAETKKPRPAACGGDFALDIPSYRTYHGTHEGPFLGVAPTYRKIHFESVDVMRVQNGKITDHWGVGNLLSLMQQIGGWIPPSCGD